MATAPMRLPELPDLRAIREDELTLGVLAGMFKRRRAIFLYVLSGFLIVVTLYCLLAMRRYQATGQVQIQKDSAGAFGLESSVMGDAADSASDALDYNITLQTEANILNSDSLALQVIKDLRLETTDDFYPPTKTDRSLGLFSWLFFWKKPVEPMTVPLDRAPNRRYVVLKIFASHLKVEPVTGTRLIDVSYSSPNPQLAADVVNHLIAALMDYTFQARFTATAQASNWLTTQLDDLRKQTQSLQAKAITLQRDTGMFGDDESHNVVLARLENLNEALAAAESNRILKEAVYRVASSGDPELISGLSGNSGVGAMASMTNSLHRLARFAFALQWAAMLALFALCSTLWSQDAMTTARRSIPFALATLLGLYFASRFSVQKQLSILTATMVLAASASIALALFFPSIGLEASTGHFGNWQGVFTQKNACGRAMVFATAALLSNGRMNIRRCVWMLLFLFVLIMSGSRGAWVIEAALFVCYGIVRVIERFTPSSRQMLVGGTIVTATISVVIAWLYFPLFAGFLGRDASLSGRTAIWQQVWTAIEKHPLLGYGFAAFWQGMKGESYNVIVALRFVIFHAHNGFLEIWLELGAAGLLLFALSYARAWRRLWPLLWSKQISHAFWMIFVLLLVALYDIDENTLFAFNGLFWILYVAVLADIEILAVEHRYARSSLSRKLSDPTHLPVPVAS